MSFSVGIIGGGASGVLVGASVLRNATAPVSVAMYEPRSEVGLGIAYSTQSDLHTLNVRAKGMSALVGNPDHFVNWSGFNRDDFAPRRVYGRYVQSILTDALQQAPPGSTFEHIRESAVDIQLSSDHIEIHGSRGRQTRVRRLVLATGNEQPTIPDWVPADIANHPRFLGSAWNYSAIDAIKSGLVVAIGTGLTFVDLSLTVLANPAVRLIGVSRHGLLPKAHQHVEHPPPLPKLETPRQVLHWLREDRTSWRERVNGLRTITEHLWQNFSEIEKQQFLRLAVRYWEIHRHRIAESTAVAIEQYSQASRLTLKKGSVAGMQATGDMQIVVALKGGEVVTADWVVLCTGPSERATLLNPPIASLQQHGAVTPGAFNMGLRCDSETGAVITEEGIPSDRIFVVGPLRKGELWESTAIPEIHVQAEKLGRLLVQRPFTIKNLQT